jgi:hypothetical protein
MVAGPIFMGAIHSFTRIECAVERIPESHPVVDAQASHIEVEKWCAPLGYVAKPSREDCMRLGNFVRNRVQHASHADCGTV